MCRGLVHGSAHWATGVEQTPAMKQGKSRAQMVAGEVPDPAWTAIDHRSGSRRLAAGSRWLPALVALAGVALSAIVAFMAHLHQQEQTAVALARRADAVGFALTGAINVRLSGLEHLAGQWEHSGRPPQSEFEFDAERYIRQHAGFQAISWVDGSGRARWVVPLARNMPAVGMDVFNHPIRRSAFRRAHEGRGIALSQTYPLIVDGVGTIAALQVSTPDGTPDGYVTAVFRVGELLDAVLREEWDGSVGVSVGGVSLLEGDAEIYTTAAAEALAERPTATTLLRLHGATWRLRVWPNDVWLAEMSSPASGIILGSGVLLALLLGVVVALAQRGQQRALDAASVRIEASRARIAEGEHLIDRLDAERNRLLGVFRHAPWFLAVLQGRDHVFSLANDAYQSLVGERDLIGRAVLDALPEIRDQRFKALLDHVLSTGEPVVGSAVPIRLQRGAVVEDRFVDFVYQPLVDAQDARIGVVVHGVDVTEKVLAGREREHLLAQIEEQRARLEAVVRQMPIGVILAEAPSGRLIMGNDHVERMFGHPLKPADEISQYREWIGYHPDGRPIAADEWPLARAVAEGSVTLGQLVRYPRGSNPNTWLRLSAAPIRDLEGRIVAGVVATEDVTSLVNAETALRESEERFRTIFEQGGLGVALFSLDGRFARANPALCRILGYTEDELLARRSWDILHPDDLAGTAALAQRLVAGAMPSYQSEERLLTKGGAPVWMLVTATLVRDEMGAPQFIIGQMQDLTALKAADSQLARQAAELQRSNEELERFAYAASHDLQEPLRMVTSFTNLLARRYAGALDETAQQYIHFASDGAKRMKILIEDLLAYSRIGSQGQAFTDVDTGALITDVMRNLAVAVDEQGARVDADGLPTVHADRVQLGQVFQNLISNALKFCAPGAAPHVQIAAADLGSAWRFSVKDNGIGVDPTYAERIFVMFQRLHTRAAYPGTGIGLTLCKRIVERHGGTIWVESQPGQGSTFLFTLPKIPAGAHAGAARAPDHTETHETAIV